MRIPNLRSHRSLPRGVLRATGFLLAAMAVAAGARAAGPGEAPIAVVVSIPPQAGIVERVGGDRVVVRLLVEPGQDPHIYEATPRQVMEIGGARLFFTIGLPFESRLVEKLQGSATKLQYVDMAAGIPRRFLVEGESHDHAGEASGHTGEAHDHSGDAHDHAGEAQADHPSAGPGGHGGGEPDPHVWLAPASVEQMAVNCARALQELDPDRAEIYERNLQAFTDEVRQADALIRELLAPLRGQRFYVFHPAFGYFADAYGLEQVAVEIEGKEPTSRRLEHVIASARADGVRVMFVQPQFSAQAASTAAQAIDGAVVPLDPLARDVIGNLEGMARQVHAALAR